VQGRLERDETSVQQSVQMREGGSGGEEGGRCQGRCWCRERKLCSSRRCEWRHSPRIQAMRVVVSLPAHELLLLLLALQLPCDPVHQLPLSLLCVAVQLGCDCLHVLPQRVQLTGDLALLLITLVAHACDLAVFL